MGALAAVLLLVEPEGDKCKIETTAATDQLAVSMVSRGEMLPADGGYFFTMEGDDSVVMRKCDFSLVARIPGAVLTDAQSLLEWVKQPRVGLSEDRLRAEE